jgi:hypothetical protein
MKNQSLIPRNNSVVNLSRNKWNKKSILINFLPNFHPPGPHDLGLRRDLTFEALARHGDFGLGTFDALDGEMIAIDGTFYQIKNVANKIFNILISKFI